jgi:hypothetical protein
MPAEAGIQQARVRAPENWTPASAGEKYDPSWPGLSRPSTISVANKDVDARHKAGHDEQGKAKSAYPRAPNLAYHALTSSY